MSSNQQEQSPKGGYTGNDVQVMGTNDDAQISKLSCVNLGYFKDDFLPYFIRKPQRRSPLINRGYYSRFAIIRKILEDFLSDNKQEKQVISLGAGFDTCWFQLKKEGKAPGKFVEIDFSNVFKRKAQIILSNPTLMEMVFENEQNPHTSEGLGMGRIVSNQYCLLPVDLRDIKQVQQELQKVNIKFEGATLILSECCLVYMEPHESSPIVEFFGSNFQKSMMVIYEQISPEDAFGRQMVANLEQRGCPLKGLKATPSIQAHIHRFTDNQWQKAYCKDMDTIYREILNRSERARIEKLEIFDEFEEWHMIQQHYCVAIGVNDTCGCLQCPVLEEFV